MGSAIRFVSCTFEESTRDVWSKPKLICWNRTFTFCPPTICALARVDVPALRRGEAAVPPTPAQPPMPPPMLAVQLTMTPRAAGPSGSEDVASAQDAAASAVAAAMEAVRRLRRRAAGSGSIIARRGGTEYDVECSALNVCTAGRRAATVVAPA